MRRLKPTIIHGVIEKRGDFLFGEEKTHDERSGMRRVGNSSSRYWNVIVEEGINYWPQGKYIGTDSGNYMEKDFDSMLKQNFLTEWLPGSCPEKECFLSTDVKTGIVLFVGNAVEGYSYLQRNWSR